MQFDPVYGLLASVSDDGTCRVWDVRSAYPPPGAFSRNDSGCVLRVRPDHVVLEHKSDAMANSSVKVKCCDWAPYGGLLATGAMDGVVRVFRTLSIPSFVTPLAPDARTPPDGTTIALDAALYTTLCVSCMHHIIHVIFV